MPKIRRVGARQGYELWASSYDATPNPVVLLDGRITPSLLRTAAGGRVLDVGCGTGRSFPALQQAGARVDGVDFAVGMLLAAHRKHPDVPLVLADVGRPWPFRAGTFDAVTCALIGEHLERLSDFFQEAHRVLRPGGQVLFSVYHPELAARGVEANFQIGDTEYRLGAFRHTVSDYRRAMERAGLVVLAQREFRGDEELARAVPAARKYLGVPMLLVLDAGKPG